MLKILPFSVILCSVFLFFLKTPSSSVEGRVIKPFSYSQNLSHPDDFKDEEQREKEGRERQSPEGKGNYGRSLKKNESTSQHSLPGKKSIFEFYGSSEEAGENRSEPVREGAKGEGYADNGGRAPPSYKYASHSNSRKNSVWVRSFRKYLEATVHHNGEAKETRQGTANNGNKNQTEVSGRAVSGDNQKQPSNGEKRNWNGRDSSKKVASSSEEGKGDVSWYLESYHRRKPTPKEQNGRKRQSGRSFQDDNSSKDNVDSVDGGYFGGKSPGEISDEDEKQKVSLRKEENSPGKGELSKNSKVKSEKKQSGRALQDGDSEDDNDIFENSTQNSPQGEQGNTSSSDSDSTSSENFIPDDGKVVKGCGADKLMEKLEKETGKKSDAQKEFLQGRKLRLKKKPSWVWNELIVYVPKGYSDKAISNLRTVLNNIHKHVPCFNTTVLVEKDGDPRPVGKEYLSLNIKATGCASLVGKITSLAKRPSGQNLAISNRCLEGPSLSGAYHELFHSLGWPHENQRADRDRYIKMLWHNMKVPRPHNVWSNSDALSIGEYQFNGVMQYDWLYASANGMPTMIDPKRPYHRLGGAGIIGAPDWFKLNEVYCPEQNRARSINFGPDSKGGKRKCKKELSKFEEKKKAEKEEEEKNKEVVDNADNDDSSEGVLESELDS